MRCPRVKAFEFSECSGHLTRIEFFTMAEALGLDANAPKIYRGKMPAAEGSA